MAIQAAIPTTIAAAVTYEPDEDFSNPNPHCAMCGSLMSGIVDGEVHALFCAICRSVDTQSLQALTALFAFLAKRSEEIGDDPSFSEFSDPHPSTRPPLPYACLRLWVFSYGITNEFMQEDEMVSEDIDCRVLVALLPDGTYKVERDEYATCDSAMDTSCFNYLHLNERNVYACSEHGEAVDEIE